MILKIGKVIYSLLVNDKKVTSKVKNNIYPLVADLNTTFPFITYKRLSVSVETTKDKYINKEEATVEVVIATDKYNESIEIASDVVQALNNKKGVFNEIEVKGIYLESADEDYIEDAFIQVLDFRIIINKQ